MLTRAIGLLPLNFLSYLTGKLASLRLPPPLARPLVRAFARVNGIDVSAASRPISEYRSIGEFFTRDLRPGIRPIADGVVSPVDGTLRSFGVIQAGVIEQIKGRDYTVAELLGDEALARRFERGTFFNLYLSPSDYHHVHFPVDGAVVERRYIPGRLWPVNDWALARCDRLFCVNERVVTVAESAFGAVAVVMVGAYNVGKMTITFDDLVTNQFGASSRRAIEPPRRCTRGERLGTFHLGSTVVMLFESAALRPREGLCAPQTVRFGERLAGA